MAAPAPRGAEAEKAPGWKVPSFGRLKAKGRWVPLGTSGPYLKSEGTPEREKTAEFLTVATKGREVPLGTAS